MRTLIHALHKHFTSAALAFICAMALGTSGGCSFMQPVEQDEPVYQAGVASWYGRQFDNLPTASGERFDMNEMTAAHRILPFGTQVRVRNLENGREVIVRINDRGPFVAGRIIDLSCAAASKLNMMKHGVATVELTVLESGQEEVYGDVAPSLLK